MHLEEQPNPAVQPDAAGAALTWAQFTRKLRLSAGAGERPHFDSGD